MRGGEVWAIWFAIAVIAFVLAMALTPVSYHVTARLDALLRRRRRDLAADAATFGEPSRDEVEAPWRSPQADEAAAALPRRGQA